MAHGMNGAIDGRLVDSLVVSHLPGLGGFLAPLMVFLLGEPFIEQTAILFG